MNIETVSIEQITVYKEKILIYGSDGDRLMLENSFIRLIKENKDHNEIRVNIGLSDYIMFIFENQEQTTTVLDGILYVLYHGGFIFKWSKNGNNEQ